MGKPVLIEMEDIVKVYPPDVVALKGVSLSVKEGEIHSIIGENGAGKSTLMKILYGMEKHTRGTIRLKGAPVNISSPREAVAHGIGMVHQEFMLIGEYTVLENIVLGQEPHNTLGLLRLDDARSRLQAIIEDFQFDVKLDELVLNLSVAAQQKTEIIKLLYREVDILILDEPTALLAPQEAEQLFVLLEQLRQRGKTILFISHKLDEVLKISDRITVMRAGLRIWTKPNKGLNKVSLSSAMVGRDVMLSVEKQPAQPGKVVLDIQDLCVRDLRNPDKLDNDQVCMQVRSGEIVGIAGVEGNGQYELVQALIGTMRAESGVIVVDGENITQSPIRQRRRKISYVSQDRKRSSSSQKDSIADNAIMTHHYVSDALLGKLGLLSAKKMHRLTQKIIKEYHVVCKSDATRMRELSGGNQQKVIVGREVELKAPLLVVDQPGRGLDVGSAEYIQKKIVEMRDAGVACLLISADLDELFSLSDRILVFHRGKITAEKLPGETTREEIGEYMLGVKGVAE